MQQLNFTLVVQLGSRYGSQHHDAGMQRSSGHRSLFSQGLLPQITRDSSSPFSQSLTPSQVYRLIIQRPAGHLNNESELQLFFSEIMKKKIL